MGTTKYTLGIESGVEHTDSVQKTSALTRIEEMQFQRDWSMESQDESYGRSNFQHQESIQQQTKILDQKTLKNTTKTQDQTPWYKKLGAAIVNTAAGLN